MDKYEYKIKSDEIKSLIAEGSYAQAAEIADTIDWRRVKSVMMLCTISDLYKINRRYEDAKNMLLLAYERRPGGRTICYSLCELCIKTEEFVKALQYYKEFVQAAPKDSGRYILQYKLYEAQEVSLEERIGVLEELKKRDYREKWAYELAYLYHRVGLATRCVEECDELILWFGAGKYVVKAMELKMLHQPLSPAQQEVYDHRFDEYVPQEETGGPDSQEDGQWNDGSQDSAEGQNLTDTDEGTASGEELDIQVKTMDVGRYNTINLQEELAAGLQEVLGENDATAAANEEAAQEVEEPEPVEWSQESEEEEMEGTEVFFGATGEMEGLWLEEKEGHGAEPLPEGLEESGVEDGAEDGPDLNGEISAEPQEAEPESEAGYIVPQGTEKGQKGLPEDAEGQEAPISAERETGSRAVPAGGEAIADENGGQAAEQVQSGGQQMTEPPRELAEVLSQEANGQISMVLPESVVVEKQITGQMKIDDILVEWEQTKRVNEEKCKEEVRKHVLRQTGPMFTEFEAAVRDGLLEKLEKSEAEKEQKAQADGGEAGQEEELLGFLGKEASAEYVEIEDLDALPDAEAWEEETVYDGEAQDLAEPENPEGYEEPGQAGLAEAADVLDESYMEEAQGMEGADYADGAGSMEEAGYAGAETMEEAGYADDAETMEEAGYADDAEAIEAEYDYAADGMEEAGYADDAETMEEAGYADDAEAIEAEYDYAADGMEEAGYVGAETMEEAGYADDAETMEEAGYADDAEAIEAGYDYATDGMEETGYAGEDESPGTYVEAAEEAYAPGAEGMGTEAAADIKDAEAIGETADAYVAEPAMQDSEEGDFTRQGFQDSEEDEFFLEDGLREEDIAEEIEEMQERLQQEAVPEAGAASEGNGRESAPASREKQPVEREKAKIRGLTREEKELFAPFIQSRRSREQLVKAIDGISMAAYTGNIIITGEEGMDTLTLAKNIIRDVRVTDRNFSGKVARISGQGLNDRKIMETLEQLNNGALIVEAASGMRPETAAMLHKCLQQERVGIIVILEDTKKAIKKLLLGTPELYGDFNGRIDLEALSNDTLVSFGRQYAREKEFSIDDLGVLALHTRIEELQTIDHAVTVAEVKQIVDEAIHHASRKTLGHFFDVLFARRYDDEDMIVLSEKDFVA